MDNTYYSIIKVPVNGFLDLDGDVQDFILDELEENTHVYSSFGFRMSS